MNRRNRLGILLSVLSAILPSVAYSAEEATEPKAALSPDPTGSSNEGRSGVREVLTFDRTENGFDLKLTRLFQKNGMNVSSPSIMLGAQWNYRFRSNTFVGLALSGMPQQSKFTATDGTTISYTTYYGGINLAQTIIAYGHLRLVASVAGGMGVVFVRSTPDAATASTVDRPNYRYVEPGGFLTLFEAEGVEFGLTGSYRHASLLTKTPAVADSDLSSAAYGLTFRTLLH